MVNREYDSELTDFGTWWHDNSDKLFRFWVYKKMFTPYEMEEKFSDESYYEDFCCDTGYIREAVELPDGDIMLGFATMGTEEGEYIEYYKLSEIRLAYSPLDKFCEDDDEYVMIRGKGDCDE